MKKIAITGSLSSGKTTASKILAAKRGPLFSADDVVKKLYKKRTFRIFLSKKLKIKNFSNIKAIIKNKILENSFTIKKVEKYIHPLVRKEIKLFINKNKKRKFIFFEIPLLIESKLNKQFDVIFFLKASRKIRLKRFMSKGGDKEIFSILNKKQLSDNKKAKFCDHVVVNQRNIKILKKILLGIFKQYE